VPGCNATIGLYECTDATELHYVLSSLPMFPWMDITVEPVATHPREQ
jgi:muconolactone D-isomerase